MRKRGGVFTIAAASVLAVAVLAAPSGAAGGKQRTVEIADNYFLPGFLKVKKGTLVKFRWAGNEEHDVTKRRGPGKPFASETTSQPGINFKKRFRKTGSYRLVCTVHPGMDMTLKVKKKKRR